jgi:hypothetical protein
MIRPDRGPAAVRHGHARAFARRLEQHLDLGALAGREVGDPPIEQQPPWRIPHADAADLDHALGAAGGVRLEHAAADMRLQRDQPAVAARVAKARAAPPPQLDLLGEDAKRVGRRQRHRDRDARPIAG